MNNQTQLTLKQIAAELSLPEATVRYYRDALEQYIPSSGTGRNRRYSPEATALLREASELVRGQGLSLEQVAAQWRNEKAINATTTSGASSAEQQLSRISPEANNATLETFRQLLQVAVEAGAQQTASATAQAIQAGFATLAEATHEAQAAAQVAQERDEWRRRAEALQEENARLKAALERPLTVRERLTGQREA